MHRTVSLHCIIIKLQFLLAKFFPALPILGVYEGRKLLAKVITYFVEQYIDLHWVSFKSSSGLFGVYCVWFYRQRRLMFLCKT
jgi:hypothetical protein